MDSLILMHQYLEGTLDDEGKKSLIELLENDPEFSETFVEGLLETGSVIKHARRLASAPVRQVAVPRQAIPVLRRRVTGYQKSNFPPRQNVNKRMPSLMFVGLVSALVIFVGMAAVWFLSEQATRSQVAQTPLNNIAAVAGLQIAEAEHVTLLRDGVHLTGTDGMRILSKDQVFVKQGSPVIYFLSDDTQLTMTMETILSLEDNEYGKRVNLMTGEVMAKVAPQPAGRPMRIKTSNAWIEVLGTTFVTRADAGETNISVSEGRIKVQRVADEASVQLGAGAHVSVRNTDATVLVVRYEAESATITKGNLANLLGASGGTIVDGQGGFNIGWNVAANAGPCQLNFSVSSYGDQRSMGVFLNDGKIGVLNVDAEDFETHSFSALLVEGTNVIELRDTERTPELNVDYLDVLHATPR